MPEYEVITSKTIEYVYRIKIDPPLDMGSDTDRLMDMQVRKAFANNALGAMIIMLEADQVDDDADEVITTVMRDGKTIIPRIHKKRAPKEPSKIGDKKMRGLFDPDPEDVAVEDAISSETEE